MNAQSSKSTIEATTAASESQAAIAPAQATDFKTRAGKRLKHFAKLGAQMAVLIGIYEAGCQVATLLPIDLPGNILGMALLLALLATHVLHGRHVGMACDFLVDNMSIFFIPAGVGIMGCFSLLQDSALKFAFVCVATTVIVFLATSYTVILVSRLQQRRHRETGEAPCSIKSTVLRHPFPASCWVCPRRCPWLSAALSPSPCSRRACGSTRK
jgi:holin-like protein